MALFLKPSADDGSGTRKSGGIRRQRDKGFIWVRQSESDPGLSMLGTSSAAPQQKDLAGDLANWQIHYYAEVDDTAAAMNEASRFLSSFADLNCALDHVYRTQPVIAATAIETSSAQIRFRKSSFPRTTASGTPAPSVDDSDVDNTKLRSLLERSVARRERAHVLIDQLLEVEDALAKSASITGVSISTVNGAVAMPTADAAKIPTLQPADADEEHRDLRNEPSISEHHENRPMDNRFRDRQDRTMLYEDVEPEQEIPLEGPDGEAVKRMEQLILRREATQNLRRIRRGYLMSFLQGIPIGALIGFGIVVVLNLPANTEMLVRFVMAGAFAVPLTLFTIMVIRNHSQSSHWRRILRP